MRFRFLSLLLVFAWSLTPPARGQSTPAQSSPKNTDPPENPQAIKQIPKDVMLVKGARSSASDSATPVPDQSLRSNDRSVELCSESLCHPTADRN
jgi:hypothetical protein